MVEKFIGIHGIPITSGCKIILNYLVLNSEIIMYNN
ncbi:hypothetical protein SAMN05444372_11481 [Flavobacterium micromati]|uniref:Uncharacterized protein n=1 Tax=Flavobacterium micromati TaxID=229205 RepID=A0A1M5Q631_9FLAO|nr:hypothetical protein SAMN05444372_11481 [Flavobacterium micromati]